MNAPTLTNFCPTNGDFAEYGHVQPASEVCFRAIFKHPSACSYTEFTHSRLLTFGDKALPGSRYRSALPQGKEILDSFPDNFFSREAKSLDSGVVEVDKPPLIISDQDDICRRIRRIKQAVAYDRASITTRLSRTPPNPLRRFPAISRERLKRGYDPRQLFL
jgi:hypothetical protein